MKQTIKQVTTVRTERLGRKPGRRKLRRENGTGRHMDRGDRSCACYDVEYGEYWWDAVLWETVDADYRR